MNPGKSGVGEEFSDRALEQKVQREAGKVGNGMHIVISVLQITQHFM